MALHPAPVVRPFGWLSKAFRFRKETAAPSGEGADRLSVQITAAPLLSFRVCVARGPEHPTWVSSTTFNNLSLKSRVGSPTRWHGSQQQSQGAARQWHGARAARRGLVPCRPAQGCVSHHHPAGQENAADQEKWAQDTNKRCTGEQQNGHTCNQGNDQVQWGRLGLANASMMRDNGTLSGGWAGLPGCWLLLGRAARCPREPRISPPGGTGRGGRGTDTAAQHGIICMVKTQTNTTNSKKRDNGRTARGPLEVEFFEEIFVT